MTTLRPMLAESVTNVAEIRAEEYYAEIKYDGIRALFVASTGKPKLYNRNGIEITYQFPELNSMEIKHEMVLDGEIVIDEGTKRDFQLLQPRIHLQDRRRIAILARQKPVRFVAFDILWYDGEPVVHKPLSERKGVLSIAFGQIGNIQYVKSGYTDFGEFTRLLKTNYEGLILKRKTSSYQPRKRSRDWLKLKDVNTTDCVIIGYTKGKGWRDREDLFGALVVGLHQNGKLLPVGKVGSGFTEEGIKYVKSLMKPAYRENGVTYVEPSLVCEVRYLDISNDGKLRQPVFLRLRTDKKPEECTWK